MASRSPLNFDSYGWEGFLRDMTSIKTINESESYQCEPGICVFINNTEFYGDGLDNLPSGDKDEASVKVTFKKLGFDVKVHQNLTAAEIKSIADRYSKMEHKGAFFLIISSHGGEGDVVYGTDGEEVKVHDLEKRFHATNCPSLAGIPKVFMIDACRGDKKEKVFSFPSKSPPPSANASATSKNIRDAADIMTIFASTRGHTASYYDKNEGSILIKTFAIVIEEVSADKNLTDIIKKVQGKIEKLVNVPEEERRVQTIQMELSFSKHYYIKRQRTPSNALVRRDAQTEFELHRKFHQQLTFGDAESLRVTRVQMYTYKF